MKAKVWIIVAVVIVLIVGGFILFKGPEPAVILPSEPLFNIGPWAVRNTVVTSWFVIVVLALFSFISTRNSSLVPMRFLQNFVEAIVEWLYGVVEDVAGETNARRFFPIVATIFLYVIVSNWFGLLPIYNTIGLVKPPEVAANETAIAVVYQHYNVGPVPIAIQPLHPQTLTVQGNANREAVGPDGQPLGSGDQSHVTGTLVPFFRSVFSDANAPLSIAIVSFFAVEYWGFSALGVGSYLGKFFNFGAVLHGQPLGVIDIFVGLLELLSEFIRIISFTFRLLGNIFAGEVLIAFMTFLVPLAVPTIFYGLELFVGFIQASVFALLTLVFAVMAVQPHEAHEEHGHEEVELQPV